MTWLLVDTSVLIKWFHSEGEADLAEARALRDAHLRGELSALVLDLALYEVGNVLSRSLGWTAADVAGQLRDLLAICGAPLVMDSTWIDDAAQLAVDHRLSFYDAAWAAAGRALKVPLVSGDRALVGAGLAETPSGVTHRLRLAGA